MTYHTNANEKRARKNIPFPAHDGLGVHLDNRLHALWNKKEKTKAFLIPLKCDTMRSCSKKAMPVLCAPEAGGMDHVAYQV